MRWRLLAALAPCLALSPAGAGASGESPRAVTLAGNEVQATEELGARSVIVVSFHRVANRGAKEWRRVLDDDPRVDGWSVYTVVVLEGAPGFVRRMVVRALRADVPAARQDSFLVVEEGGDAWRDLAGSNGEEESRPEAVFVIRLEDGAACRRYRGLASATALERLLGAPCAG